jgi:hypothetical protein
VVVVALFTNKADANLPLLTKIVQVDCENREEFIQFLEDLSDRYSRFDLVLRVILDDEDPFDIGLVDYKNVLGGTHPIVGYWEGIFSQIVGAFEIAQRVMGGLASESTVKWEDVLTIEKCQSTLTFEASIRPLTSEAVIPLSDLRSSPGSDYDPLLSVVCTNLAAILRDGALLAAKGQKIVDSCDECGFPFVVQKPGQRYCSHRCRHREGSRRRYMRKPGNDFSDTGNQ